MKNRRCSAFIYLVIFPYFDNQLNVCSHISVSTFNDTQNEDKFWQTKFLACFPFCLFENNPNNQTERSLTIRPLYTTSSSQTERIFGLFLVLSAQKQPEKSDRKNSGRPIVCHSMQPDRTSCFSFCLLCKCARILREIDTFTLLVRNMREYILSRTKCENFAFSQSATENFVFSLCICEKLNSRNHCTRIEFSLSASREETNFSLAEGEISISRRCRARKHSSRWLIVGKQSLAHVIRKKARKRLFLAKFCTGENNVNNIREKEGYPRPPYVIPCNHTERIFALIPILATWKQPEHNATRQSEVYAWFWLKSQKKQKEPEHSEFWQ